MSAQKAKCEDSLTKSPYSVLLPAVELTAGEVKKYHDETNYFQFTFN